MTVRLADQNKSVPVVKLHAWNRGDIAGPVMSSSSGPKDYLKNQAWAIFEAQKSVRRIVVFRIDGRGASWGTLFSLLQGSNGQWFDVSGAAVVLEGDV